MVDCLLALRFQPDSRSQKEWISNLRNLYRYLPFARSTYRHAAAIIAASSQTYAEFASYRDKLFFVPEPGVSSLTCAPMTRAIRTVQQSGIDFRWWVDSV